MTTHVVIDSDGHVMEPVGLWQRYMPEHLRDRAPRFVGEGHTFLEVDGHVVPPPRFYPGRELFFDEVVGTADRFEQSVEAEFSAASQLAGMDKEGIDLSVLFPSRGLSVMGVDGADPIVTTAAAHAYNTWLAEFCADGNGRLLGSGMIDPRDVDGACEEARRCVEQLGFVAVFLRPNPVLGRTWHDPVYEPLWSTLESLDIVVAFHEGGAVELPQAGTDRFLEHGLWHLCTHPMEQQMAMISMVMGGVLERHPALRAAFLECGAGWVPYWVWRMDEGFETERQSEFSHLTRRPSEYIRSQCFASIDSDEETGVATLDLLEGTHVVWGSDYPHPDGKFPIAYKTLASLPGVTADRLQKVVQDNPIEMFGHRMRDAVDARR